MRFAPYLRRLYGYALALTHDADQASELVQDCVVRAMAARQTPADESAYRAYLFAIIRNLWLDSRRRAPPGGPAAVIDESTLGSGDLCAAEDIVVNSIAVRQALAKLTPDHRDILALVDIAGFGYREAGAMLGVPIGTVMSRVSRARQILCQLLGDGVVTPLPASRRTSSP